MKPHSIVSRIRRIAAAFGDDYRGSVTYPVDEGYVTDVQLATGPWWGVTVSIYWEPRA